MVLSLQPDRSGERNVGACLLAVSALEDVRGQCMTVCLFVSGGFGHMRAR